MNTPNPTVNPTVNPNPPAAGLPSIEDCCAQRGYVLPAQTSNIGEGLLRYLAGKATTQQELDELVDAVLAPTK